MGNSILISGLPTGSLEAPSDGDGGSDVVSEGAVFGDLVGITASSVTPAGETVSYSLSEDANGRFVIDSTTGVVSVGASHLLDYESSDAHTITVEATSSGGSTAATDFTISVTDEAEPLEIYQVSRSGDTITYGVKVNTSFYDENITSWGYTISFDPSELTFAGTAEANGNVTSGATNLNLDMPIMLADLLDGGVSGSDGVADSLTFAGFALPPGVAHDFTQPVATFDMTLGADVVEAGLFTPDVENKDYTSFGSTQDYTPNKAVFDYLDLGQQALPLIDISTIM